MEVSGSYLTIESVKKVSVPSFCKFLALKTMELIEENKGDFTKLETDGSDWMKMLIEEYEEGGRLP